VVAPQTGMRVLIVEDDPAIAEPLADNLRGLGFGVASAGTGAEALAWSQPVDVVLLDLGLPDLDGTEVCRRLRAASDVPIIILTARGDEVDRVVGLELGADDYVVKPFGFRELVARIRAVTRRRHADGERRVDEVGRLRLDRAARRVFVDGEEVALTAKEFDLLALLMEEAGVVVQRRRILERVWDTTWYGPSRSLDVHIASLRRKLGHPSWVETVRGIGFRLGDPT
jgi:two-component system, OmpR family, response regulator RegX3